LNFIVILGRTVKIKKLRNTQKGDDDVYESAEKPN